MRKRSSKLQEVITAVNELLQLENLFITLEDGSSTYVASANPKAQLFKQGICDAIEIILHKTNSYNGYMFLDNKERDKGRKFDRKYF
jgi:hypothetical protein